MRSKILVLISCLLSLGLLAQKSSSSPYSSYGIGIFGGLDHPNFSGIGNVTSPVHDSTVLNFYNPASYALLGKGQPLFSTGISGQFSTFTENNNSINKKVIGINHFAFAIPFAKRLGLAFGLKPYTRTGYEIINYEALGIDTIKYSYIGKGSTNQIFTGFSWKVFETNKNLLSLGTNISYVFGTSNHQQLSNPTTSSAGGVQETNYQIKSLHYEFGLNYQLMFAHNRKLSIGFCLTPQQNLTSSREVTLSTAVFVENENTYTTLLNEKINNSITIPTIYSIGFAYQHRPKIDSSFNRTKVYQLTVFGEYKSSSWNNFQTNFDNTNTRIYKNSQQFGLGIEFTPHYNFMERTTSIGYLNRVKYRAGVQYMTLPYSINNKQLNDAGVTLGFKFPIISQRSVSSLTLGVVYGKRGEATNISLNEKYLGINLGITIAPGNNDRWFRKYKID